MSLAPPHEGIEGGDPLHEPLLRAGGIIPARMSAVLHEDALVEADNGHTVARRESFSRLHPVPDVVEEEPTEKKGRLREAVSELPAVSVAVVMMMVNAVTYGSLVFHTPVFAGATDVPDGIVVWLVATSAAQVGVLAASGLPSGIGSGTIEDIPILHAMFVNIARAMPGAEPDEVVGTCLALVFLATLLQGLLLLQAGRLGASRVLRAVPLVVLKGALCGVSLFLLRSGVDIARSGIPDETFLESWQHWLIAIAVGTFYFALDEHFHSPMGMAVALLLLAAAPAIAISSGLVQEDFLRVGGWVFDAPAAGAERELWYDKLIGVYSRALPRARWSVIAGQVPAMVGLWFSHALLSLMDLKAIELLTGAEIVLNSELRTLGVVNVLSAVCGGGWPTYILCSINVTFYKLGARTRFASSLVLLGLVGGLFIAERVVPFLPRALPASVAWWLGIVFMKETIVDIAMQHSHKLDIFIVVSMATTMIISGFLEGLLLGFMLAMGAFTLMYSAQQAAVGAHSDARYFRSNVGRPHVEQELLEQHGQRIAVVHLTGYLMFGSSPQLLDSVLPLLTPQGPDWVVLNFRDVQGFDYSAVLDLVGLGRRAQHGHTTLVLTELRGQVPSIVLHKCLHVQTTGGHEEESLTQPGLCYVRYYQSALRKCEDALLAKLKPPLPVSDQPSGDRVGWLLGMAFGEYLVDGQAEKLRGFFDEESYPPGATLWNAGDPPKFMAGVLEGELLVFQDMHERGGHPWLQELARPGTFLGFASLTSHTPHSTSAVVPSDADNPGAKPCRLLRLHYDGFLRLCKDEPRLATGLLRGLLRRISFEWRDLSRLAAHA